MSSKRSAIALAAVFGFGMAAFLLAFSRSVVSRLSTMRLALSQVAGGDLTVRCQLRGSDELSDMGQTMSSELAALIGRFRY